MCLMFWSSTVMVTMTQSAVCPATHTYILLGDERPFTSRDRQKERRTERGKPVVVENALLKRQYSYYMLLKCVRACVCVCVCVCEHVCSHHNNHSLSSSVAGYHVILFLYPGKPPHTHTHTHTQLMGLPEDLIESRELWLPWQQQLPSSINTRFLFFPCFCLSFVVCLSVCLSDCLSAFLSV